MPDKDHGFNLAGLLSAVPPWSRAIIFAIITIPVSVAISGVVLNVNLGTYLDQYLAILLERQKENTDDAADRVIARFDQRLTDIEVAVEKTRHAGIQKEKWFSWLSGRADNMEARVEALEMMACKTPPCLKAENGREVR